MYKLNAFAIYLFVCLFIYWFILFVYLFIYLFILLYLFMRSFIHLFFARVFGKCYMFTYLHFYVSAWFHCVSMRLAEMYMHFHIKIKMLFLNFETKEASCIFPSLTSEVMIISKKSFQQSISCRCMPSIYHSIISPHFRYSHLCR